MHVPGTHIINRQIFDFKIESKEHALGFRQELQDVYQRKLLQTIEAVFDRIAGNGEVIRIDKLELNLGSLKNENWEKQLIEQVENKLYELVSQYKPVTVSAETAGINTAAPATQSAAVTKYRTPPGIENDETATLEEALVYYLINGSLPWYIADETDEPDPEAFFIALLKDQPLRLIRQLQLQEHIPVIFRRIVQQFSESTIRLFLEKSEIGNRWPETDAVLQAWNAFDNRRVLAADVFRVFVLLTEPKSADELKTIHTPESPVTRRFVLLNRCIELQAMQEKTIVRSKLQQAYITLLEQAEQKTTVKGLEMLLPWLAGFETRKLVNAVSYPGETKPMLETFLRLHPDAIRSDKIPAVLKKQVAGAAAAFTASVKPAVTAITPVPEEEKEDLLFTDELAEEAWADDGEEPEIRKSPLKKEHPETASSKKKKQTKKVSAAEERFTKKVKQEEETVPSKKQAKNKAVAEPENRKTGKNKKTEAEQTGVKTAAKTAAGESPKPFLEPGKPYLTEKKTTEPELKKSITDASETAESNLSDYQAPKWSTGQSKRIITRRAGIVLLAPYFPALFGNLGFLDEEGLFVSEEKQHLAVHLLNFIAGGKTKPHEYTLALPKMLCGVPLEQPVPRDIKPGKKEKQEATELLDAVAQLWTAMKTESGEALRHAFMQRNGILEQKDGAWLLRIERTTIDIMLDTLPWSLSMIKHSWMNTMLHIEW